MHRKIEVKEKTLFEKIRELSNPSKFKILEVIQDKKMNITLLAKKVNLAFNKCSNYCSELEKDNFIVKERQGKNVFVESKIKISKLKEILDQSKPLKTSSPFS